MDNYLDTNYQTPPQEDLSRASNFSLVKELSPKGELLDMVKELQGKVWNQRTGQYEQIEGLNPIMNDRGVNMFYHYATSAISPVVTFSNYTKDYQTIHSLVNMVLKHASTYFHFHYKECGLDVASIKVILDKLQILAISAFYKAIGAGDRKAATSNISETIQTLTRPTEQENKQKSGGGFLNRLINPSRGQNG